VFPDVMPGAGAGVPDSRTGAVVAAVADGALSAELGVGPGAGRAPTAVAPGLRPVPSQPGCAGAIRPGWPETTGAAGGPGAARLVMVGAGPGPGGEAAKAGAVAPVIAEPRADAPRARRTARRAPTSRRLGAARCSRRGLTAPRVATIPSRTSQYPPTISTAVRAAEKTATTGPSRVHQAGSRPGCTSGGGARRPRPARYRQPRASPARRTWRRNRRSGLMSGRGGW
jgi:pilus assembly protein FimV